MSTYSSEVEEGKRFEFGKNWAAFLKALDEDRIGEAEKSLLAMLKLNDLLDRTFLDIGSGSGLSSLAARRLGAKVHSFDYDLDSVACTKELKHRYFTGDSDWRVQAGSVLDQKFLAALGQFDIVYSWGVLHHTGEMWQALENVTTLVKDDGMLFIAIYNDQGFRSQIWKRIKNSYCSGTSLQKKLMLAIFNCYASARGLLVDLIKMENPLRRYRLYRRARGMSLFRDREDWLGGYPFEVASPEQIFLFFKEKGFTLQNMQTTNSPGCNEFVFRKEIQCVE